MEIERKFLVERIPPELSGSGGTPIDQGYLAIDEESEVRLRRSGETLTLTVKNGHGESRQETEVDLDRATFEELWPETEGRRVTKSRLKVDLEGGLIAELDRYGGSLEGIAVVEVEFESGDAAGKFVPPAWFGRELTGDPAWTNQSLAIEGRPEKGLEYRLRPGEELATGICRVITARAAQAAAAVRQAGSSEEPAGHVHEARKSLKKVRSALRMLRGVIPIEERQEANTACRDAASRLAGARDAEVKLATLAKLSGESDPEGADDWRDELETEADSHRGDLTPEGLAEVARAIEEVARSFRGRELPAAGETVTANIIRSYRRGRKAMREALASDDPEAFHDWRKRAKDLRYQLEIVEPELPKRLVETRRKAEELADLLGDLHDLDVLAGDLSARDLESEDLPRLTELIDQARDRQAGACINLGEKTYKASPEKFGKRLARALGNPGGADR